MRARRPGAELGRLRVWAAAAVNNAVLAWTALLDNGSECMRMYELMYELAA